MFVFLYDDNLITVDSILVKFCRQVVIFNTSFKPDYEQNRSRCRGNIERKVPVQRKLLLLTSMVIITAINRINHTQVIVGQINNHTNADLLHQTLKPVSIGQTNIQKYTESNGEPSPFGSRLKKRPQSRPPLAKQ